MIFVPRRFHISGALFRPNGAFSSWHRAEAQVRAQVLGLVENLALVQARVPALVAGLEPLGL